MTLVTANGTVLAVAYRNLFKDSKVPSLSTPSDLFVASEIKTEIGTLGILLTDKTVFGHHNRNIYQYIVSLKSEIWTV